MVPNYDDVTETATVNILWGDLSERGKQKMIDTIGCDPDGENYDVFPIAVIEFEVVD